MSEVLTLPGIARFFDVKRETARAMIERGEIPANRHGKRGWRVLRSTLEQHEHEKAVAAMEARRRIHDVAQHARKRARGRSAEAPPDLSRYETRSPENER